jgi:hypothetical protein
MHHDNEVPLQASQHSLRTLRPLRLSLETSRRLLVVGCVSFGCLVELDGHQL